MKHIKIGLIFIFVILLSGCQAIIESAQSWIGPMSLSEDEQAYQDFLMDDILILSGYIDVVNDLTYNVMPSVVEVNFEIISLPDLSTTSNIKGSAIILETDANRSYAVTSSDFFNDDPMVIKSLFVKNVRGETTNANVIYVDHDKHLMWIEFLSFDDQLSYLPTLSNHLPKVRSPFFMLGLNGSIQFGMTMGLIEESEQDSFQTNVLHDTIKAGNVIVNLSGDILGIYTTYDATLEMWLIATISDITSFLNDIDDVSSQEVS